MAIRKQNKTKQKKTRSNLDGNGNEIFTQKMNAYCLKLHRPYSKCFNFSNVGVFSTIELLKNVSKFTKKKRKSLSRVHVFHKT